MFDVDLFRLDDNISVYFTGRKVVLPPRYAADCEAHWLSLEKTGKKYFRGDIFTISEVKCKSDKITLSVDLTDYAHFLYTIHKNTYEEHDCRVIYVSALIETSDRKFVIGVMGNDTFAPGKLQLVGGGVDQGDITGHQIDLNRCINKEIAEEVGIDTENTSVVKTFELYLLKTGGPSNFYSAIFKLDLTADENGLSLLYERHVQNLMRQGKSPEFSSLLFVPADSGSVEELVTCNQREKDENLIPALKAAIGLYPVKTLAENNGRL